MKISGGGVTLPNLDSGSLVSHRIQQFQSLFPEAFCENQIDWEKLKLILGADNLCESNERYQLNWAGKSAAYRALQSPTFNTLIPCKSESVDFDATQNVFIEAENMEALKILQKSYAGSVKMIYIDPPYNTGNDSFIYPDKFSETRDEYARRVGDKDQNGYLKRDGVFQGAFRKNSRDSGHYHSNWLNMMLPRLHLAKTLLREDGVIFISIDDNEQAQLKLLCDEVFGAENFVANVIWEKRYTRSNNARMFTTLTEQILCYRKSDHLQDLKEPRNEKADSIYSNPDNDPRGVWTSVSCVNPATREQRPNLAYEMQNPHTGEIIVHPTNAWKFEYQKYLFYSEDNRLYWGKNGENKYPRLKKFLTEMDGGMVPVDLWKHDETGTTDAASRELEDLIGKGLFTFPKPPSLVKRMLKIAANDQDSLILDFFSGSGTTAHAVMQLNAEDGGKRRYICVQLPEETDEKSEARKAGFANIAEIAKERIRRAGAQIRAQGRVGMLAHQSDDKGQTVGKHVHPMAEQKLDTGFKVFKLVESNFKQWRSPESRSSDGLEAQLEIFRDVVETHATVENMAYELALRLGFQLTDPMIFSDGVVWLNNAAGSRKTALLLETASDELLRNVLAQQPQKVFALDKAFGGDDALKTNAALQCQDAGVAFETL